MHECMLLHHLLIICDALFWRLTVNIWSVVEAIAIVAVVRRVPTECSETL